MREVIWEKNSLKSLSRCVRNETNSITLGNRATQSALVTPHLLGMQERAFPEARKGMDGVQKGLGEAMVIGQAEGIHVHLIGCTPHVLPY